MSEKWRWYREPIIIVPILGIAIALGIVPFAVWGQSGASAFYGSLTAALIAAGAVVGNSRLQSIEFDRQQTALARRNAHEAAIQTLGYARYAVTQLFLLRGVAKVAKFKTSISAVESPTDKTINTVGQFRSISVTSEIETAHQIIQICSKMSPQISSKVSEFLYFFITMNKHLVQMPVASPTDTLDRQTIQSLIENCDSLIDMGAKAIGQIEDFLIDDGIGMVKYVVPTRK